MVFVLPERLVLGSARFAEGRTVAVGVVALDGMVEAPLLQVQESLLVGCLHSR